MGAAHWDPNLGWCTKLWFTKAAGVANSCFTKAAGEANSWFTKAPGEPNFLVHLRYSCQGIAPYSRKMPPLIEGAAVKRMRPRMHAYEMYKQYCFLMGQ